MKLPGIPAAALFDVDGTLVDTVRHETAAWLEALRTVDANITFERVLKQMGKGADQLLPALLPGAVIRRDGARLAKLQGRLFRAKYRARVRPFPRLQALFRRLRRVGTKIALVSSGDRADIAYYEALAGISEFVDVVVCADDVEHSKPSGDVFRVAMTRLAPVSPDDVIAIGDSPFDAKAAAHLAIATIGVTCGGAFGPIELLEAGCIAVLQTPAELIAFLGLNARPLR